MVLPGDDPPPLKFILHKVPLVRTSIGPLESSTFLLASMEVPSEDCSIGPVFLPHAVLKIANPLSLADHPLKMAELTDAIGLTELPIAVVVVFIRVDVYSKVIKVIVPEMPIVVCPTRKIELANTLDYPVAASLANTTPVVAYLYLLMLFRFEVYFFKLFLVEVLNMGPLALEVVRGQGYLVDRLLHPLHQQF